MINAIRHIPAWSSVAPALALLLLGAKEAGLVSDAAPVVLGLAALLLGASVFASVHHAEVVALKVGEPFGSIVLAVAVTVIEVALIVSIMVEGGKGSETLARDTVYSTVMIVLSGIVGLCLVLGGVRHHVQAFRTEASGSA